GLALTPDGQVGGTPTAAGTFAVTVTATGAGGATGSTAYSLVVHPALALGSNVPAALLQGSPADPVTATATGGTGMGFTFAVTSGQLPDGLTLSPDGVLTGTPAAAGQVNLVVTATDSGGGTGALPLVLTVVPRIAFADTGLNPVNFGQAFTQRLSASGGAAPLKFQTDSPLPGGVRLAADGTLSGTPTAGGLFHLRVVATDSAGFSAGRDFDLRVNGAPVPPPNKAPATGSDRATATQGAALVLNVLANDRDPDGGALVVSAVNRPEHGSATLVNGKIRYVPAGSFFGTDR